MEFIIGGIFLILYFIVSTVSFYASESVVSHLVQERSVNRKYFGFLLTAVFIAAVSVATHKLMVKIPNADLSPLFFPLSILLLGPIIIGALLKKRFPNVSSGAFLGSLICPWFAVFIFVVSENVGVL